jgi:phosphoribosylanthranilate isomerase
MASHLRVKICGITNEADASQAAELGADAIGLNFYSASPRYVQPHRAAAILRGLPPFVDPVGLFVEQKLSDIVDFAKHFGRIRTIQWHGRDHEISNLFPYRFIPAFHVDGPSDLQTIEQYLAACREAGYAPDAVVIDAHVPGQYGGTGQTAPWEIVASFRPEVPVILAGGLTPENVSLAVRIVRPYGVDVASGVEDRPGHKDPGKMRRFIEAAREATGA